MRDKVNNQAKEAKGIDRTADEQLGQTHSKNLINTKLKR